ncbi:penicillin-binding protein activator [Teredinibacter turnerae]|uniref:penicillin-binding protein activator n=1 Tax=Teredinibacter turnerae TaxID=2426 RepID=UPI00040535B9|nr:penicillin-binding protein activator [Teredinibacter turnerae]
MLPSFTFLRPLVLASGMLLLASCGNQPVKPNNAQASPATLSVEEINTLLTDAEAATGEERNRLLLQAAQAMLQSGELDWARNTLSKISLAGLSAEHYFTVNMLNADVALASGRQFIARRYLWDEHFEQVLSAQPLNSQISARTKRAALLYDLAEYRFVVGERILLDRLLEQASDAQLARDANQDALWQALMELPLKDLQLEARMQSNPEAKGWFTLAALSKNNQTNMRLQLESVENWALNWPEHPASLRLPADLQLLKQLVAEKPQKIAVLLPLSGQYAQASQAIRDGLMAAYYGLAAQGDALPDLQYYDTEGRDINALFDEVVTQGAQLVIGPLSKENIDELALRPSLPVPTLALNYAEHQVGLTDGLYQFGLAVEDEARQVAQRAWRDGHRRALILAPDGGWGDRNVDTFAATWQALGGTLAGDYRFKTQKDYSRMIAEAMDVTQSKQRASHIRGILGQSLEFEPRPRKDIDLIFLVARPAEARQIKPTLAYHYAGKIPVYATSHIYNGVDDANADRDMNGIRFTTLPWFFDGASEEKPLMDAYVNGSAAFERLYALGVDAFHVYPRLRQLAQVRQAHYYGNTGRLNLDQQHRIVREQTWAQFKGGKAYATPTVSYEDTESF